MSKFLAMAIAVSFVGAAFASPAQATNKPELPESLLAQSQVPTECQGIDNPAKREKCIQEKGKK